MVVERELRVADLEMQEDGDNFPLDTNRWFAVQCQAHRERLAAAHLINQNFETFLPLLERTRRHARRLETSKVPFFPGYLFVRLDVGRHRWRSVNGTVGVVRLLTHGDQPAPVPLGFVEGLKALSLSDVVEWRPDLALGQSVRVLAGPFAGLIGELGGMLERDRVRVLLRVLGGQFPVSLPRLCVAPTESVI